MEEVYKIGELANEANVTKRTIHYYVSRGLLPSPKGAGVGTYYSDEHLYRILLIKKYQGNYLPLDEIKKRITILTMEEVKQIIEEDNIDQNTLVYEDSNEYNVGDVYKRIELDYGVEIHYCSDNPNAENLVRKLYKHSKMIEED
mgnify:CR=1 FL=1